MSDVAMPQRYNKAVIAHVMVDGAAAAIDFYRQTFGADELFRVAFPSGKILHAEIAIHGSLVMVGDAEGEFGSPTSLGSTTVGLHVYVDDLDALYDAVTASDAELLQEPTDMFYGARTMMVKDPFGHVWVFLQHTEDMSPQMIAEKGNALLSEM